MLILQVQVLLVGSEPLNAQDMERKAAKDQHGYLHAQQEKHLLPQWENVANLTRYQESFMIQNRELWTLHRELFYQNSISG